MDTEEEREEIKKKADCWSQSNAAILQVKMKNAASLLKDEECIKGSK
jgi:hypothetical protein